MGALLLFAAVCLTDAVPVHAVPGDGGRCSDKPVFTPASLVVKHGDAATATCVPCRDGCPQLGYDLKASVGYKSTNGTALVWTVDSLTKWDAAPTCYYKTESGHCVTTLPVTVYKPPEKVFLTLSTGSRRAMCGKYNLQCTVRDVAPIRNLTVTFYKGRTLLVQFRSYENDKRTPETDVFTLRNITAAHHVSGALLRCEAALHLGPAGPQPPPVVASENMPELAYYHSCEGGPSFSPPALAVQYAAAAAFRCTACRDACQQDQIGLDAPPGQSRKDGNVILWSIDKLTRWDVTPTCYYDTAGGERCCASLPVTVYKHPSFVFLRLLTEIGGTPEEDQHSLTCQVINVAPIERVAVTFHRGNGSHTLELGRVTTNKSSKTPASETFVLKVDAFEDDPAQYWCQAELEFGPQVPEISLVFNSSKVQKNSDGHELMASSAKLISSLSWCFALLMLLLM